MLLSEIRDEGWEEGREEGRTEERANLIRRIAANGKSAEEIAEMTGLPLDIVLRAVNSEAGNE